MLLEFLNVVILGKKSVGFLGIKLIIIVVLSVVKIFPLSVMTE